jgi:hypothetical protein
MGGIPTLRNRGRKTKKKWQERGMDARLLFYDTREETEGQQQKQKRNTSYWLRPCGPLYLIPGAVVHLTKGMADGY